MTRWSRHNRSAANTAVIAVGPLPAATALDGIAREFSSWRQGEPTPPVAAPLPPARRSPALIVTPWAGAPQTRIAFGCRLPTPSPDDVAWQDLFASSLDDTLFRTVRDGLGASYGFEVGASTLRGGASELTLSGFVANAAVPAVLEVLRGLIGGLGEGRWPSMSLDEDRWSYFTRRWLAAGYGPAIAGDLLAEWNRGWPVDGGARAMRGLTHVDQALLSTIARTCHDSATLVLTGDPSVTRSALARAVP